MVFTFSGHKIVKKMKVMIKIMILTIILVYILPKLLSLLWYIHYPEYKMREEHLLEKPLRVMAIMLEIS